MISRKSPPMKGDVSTIIPPVSIAKARWPWFPRLEDGMKVWRRAPRGSMARPGFYWQIVRLKRPGGPGGGWGWWYRLELIEHETQRNHWPPIFFRRLDDAARNTEEE